LYAFLIFLMCYISCTHHLILCDWWSIQSMYLLILYFLLASYHFIPQHPVQKLNKHCSKCWLQNDVYRITVNEMYEEKQHVLSLQWYMIVIDILSLKGSKIVKCSGIVIFKIFCVATHGMWLSLNIIDQGAVGACGGRSWLSSGLLHCVIW
jgi:hypothetical protein